ncbi:MAG: NBR1-Ig-like domain-containing protein [Myxococcaceae bacterium]
MRSTLFVLVFLSGCVGSASLVGGDDEHALPCGGSDAGTTTGTPPTQPMPDAGTPPATDAGTPPTPDAGTPPAPDAGPAFVDDAQQTGDSFPPSVRTSSSRTVVITVKNTGTSTWTRAGGFALAALGGGDPFTSQTQLELGAGDQVAPGDSYDFSFAFTAPATAGVRRTDWKMVHAGVAFGGELSRDVDVTAPVSAPPFDLASVTIVGSPDVRGFAVTSTLTDITFRPDNFHIDHSKRGQWPGVVINPADGTTQEATVWVFFAINGTWYGTGGERLRPNQADKQLTNASDVGPGWLYDPNRWGPMTNYVPLPGELVGFMVVAGSTRSDNNVIVQERSNVVLIPFPADGVTASYPPFAWTE